MTLLSKTGPGFAPAKINLTLHVTGQRGDGFHLLDSIVAFADVGDRLSARPAPVPSLRVHGPMAAGVPEDGRNLVLKAAAAMGASAAFTLEKHLPAAAGIGGGSSDAAAALRLLSAMTGQSPPDHPEVLGADIPVCLMARAARMRGIGEVLSPLALPPLPAVLVNPRVEVPTGAVFAGLARKDNAPMPDPLPTFDDPRQAIAFLATQRNDLEPPARQAQPVIDEVLTALRALPGAALARMSGSGATCFALFERPDDATEAARLLAAAHTGWWIAPTCLS
ncbi:4-(cytidine 5'-diphospho)-2-C-methyl-D-erythritol kinase [Rhodalgimonas zhirmunskyi]|uniref:4-diphosphocytidyl-2-C-methyl-D-erythritol kinase n=1 Tax=Rhodalgimonas zhirmunskyi TaxID=2964767 RepID=A0AAJ1U4H3_9RHOB|nr:4-(cytidine 5'-diphospho)-2-C-methyl-D-erythritol kinase [Rhodoalgimonas zhirmunskyi]MDQ2093541.1 4-(cytidine 5'-diphospho)-2-C-methyl-D-erythritol kinase [Rhodoalgimonas zhirmunskyi]